MPSGSLQAVWTTGAKNEYANIIAGISGGASISYFRVGLGGRFPDGSVRPPNPTLMDLDIIENPSNYPAYPNPPYDLPYYQSTAGSVVLSVPVPGTVRVSCVLSNATYNSSQTATPTPPLICEIGIFDANNLMVAYGTFAGVTKTAAVSLTLNVDLVL